MKPTQETRVKNRLLTYGKISRNECLQNFITRLSAIIFNLQEQGWSIEGQWIKTERGKDYEYTLIEKPTKQVSRPVYNDNGTVKIIRVKEEV